MGLYAYSVEVVRAVEAAEAEEVSELPGCAGARSLDHRAGSENHRAGCAEHKVGHHRECVVSAGMLLDVILVRMTAFACSI
jgi:hypothetical protein